jgi:23S rRNA (uracil1939-C5)-methyltransferase
LNAADQRIVTIESIVPGGLGLARDDGRVILVPQTAPGDTCLVSVRAGQTRAELLRILQPSPTRATPACQHFGVCGGCDFMHLTYEAQLAAKQGIIADALRRTGRFADLPDIRMVPNPAPLGDRMRAAWHVAPNGGAGYYRRGSHEVIDIHHCPIIDPVLEARRQDLRPTGEVDALSNGVDVSMRQDGHETNHIEIEVAGFRFLASADVFFQTTRALLRPFVEHVVASAAPSPTDRVTDLYAGVGLFSIPISASALTVDGVEGSEAAVLLALENARINNRSNCAFHAMPVETWLRACPAADIMIVDPPRTGLGKAAIALLPKKVRSRLVYVSCDPVTFARDARILVDAGLRIRAITGFDIFPQTRHVELVAVFER